MYRCMQGKYLHQVLYYISDISMTCLCQKQACVSKFIYSHEKLIVLYTLLLNVVKFKIYGLPSLLLDSDERITVLGIV